MIGGLLRKCNGSIANSDIIGVVDLLNLESIQDQWSLT